MTVVFVNMPVAGIERPSIALGTLKSILTQAGIEVRVAYANLWFAEHIGLESYQQLDMTRAQDVLGDWLFSASAFPDHAPDNEAYLNRLLKSNPRLVRDSLPETIALLTGIRRQAAGFVDLVVDRILALRPTIVGCTSMFQQNVASLALLRRLRERAPEIVTMMGGANCETVMGRTLHENFTWVDYVVSGEADELIVELCRKALDQGRAIAAADVPFGALAPCHRTEGYPRIETGDGMPRAIVQDMRKVPVPDYSDYFEELETFIYGRDVYPGLPIETSRGCWWGAKSHCTFCGLNGGSMSFRSKPPEQARAEIESLVARHNITRIQAVDNILDTNYITELVPGLAARTETLSIFFEVKSNLKRHQIELFARAGIRSIQPGIESLDTRVLQLMRKGCSAWQNLQLLKWTSQFGVGTAWTIIFGFPGEQDAWHAETARLLPALHHLQPGGMTRLRYDRYSPYFNRPEAWNLSLKADDSYSYAYPLSPEKLEDIAYFMQAEPATAPTAAGPGLIALSRAHAAWRQAHRAAGPPLWRIPVLAMERQTDGGAIVTDTRECALAETTKLGAADVAALDLADAAPTGAQLRGAIAAQHGLSPDEADQLIERLENARFMIQVDGRVVSLVLDHPVAMRPRLRDRPNGYVRQGKAVKQLTKALNLVLTGAS
jgi:ribosomal peptide maturation radical SAM protein 1